MLLPEIPLSLVASTKVLSKDYRNSHTGSAKAPCSAYPICNSGQWQMLDERMSEYVKNSGDFCHILLVSSDMVLPWLKFSLCVELFWMDFFFFFSNWFNNFLNSTSGFLYVLLQIYCYVTLYRSWVGISKIRTSSEDFVVSSLASLAPTLYY